MVLPRLRPGTGALLAIAVLLLVAVSAPAVAAGVDVYTVRDVEVDVTADSAAAARDQAFYQAQRKAFDKLLLTLSRPEDVAALPPIEDDAIADMVLDFEIESESTSSVRYIGNMAFRFRGEPVRAYLERGGAGYAVSAPRPALVLPVATRDGSSLLWDDSNDWFAAWSRDPVSGTLVSLVVPLGDLTDISTIDAEQALAGDTAALQSIAERYRAGEVVVATVSPTDDPADDPAGDDPAGETIGLDLDARLYGPAGLIGSIQDSFSAPSGDTALAELHEQAAQRVSEFVQESWKQANLVSSTVEQRLAVVAPIAGLEDWVDLQRRLADVSTLRRTDLLRLSRSEARLDLVFVGNRDQLAGALAQRALTLVPAPRSAAPGTAQGALPGAAPAPAAPQTSGSVTVYPDAVVPPQTSGSVTVYPPMSAQPAWELRRTADSTGQPAMPALTSPTVQPGTATDPALPEVQPGNATDPASSPPAAE